MPKTWKKLEREIAKLQKTLTAEKVELDKASRKLEQLKKTNLNQDLESLRKELTVKQRDLSVLQSREKEHREFLERVGQRTESLTEELSTLRTQVEGADPQIKLLYEELQQLTTRLEGQRDTLQGLTEEMNTAVHNFNEANIHHIHLTNQKTNLERELEQREAEIERYGTNNAKLKGELDQVRNDTDELISSNLQDDETMVRFYNQKKEQERQVGILEERVAQARNVIYQLEESLSDERKKREQLADKRTEIKEQATEIRIELNGLRERMSVEFQIEVSELSEVVLFDKPVDTYALEDIEASMMKVRHRVQNYGEINPMAVEAFTEMKERFDFINGQKNDLLEAKASLLSTIEEIDQTAKEKFLETFVQVREYFMEVFRSLFSDDDKCDLILMDPENPLDSDVNIIARPKGKRPLTIKQLSGGEKTLTAVALLFAIYRIKPAPFCVFDEVDAPLDDANIDKFNNIIQEFSATSQFIIVTHNKRTMASVNIIYGVTMENTGVSRLLPVSLDELVGMN
ncbi:MAG: AAA family ATPase [Bacteroidota bacterium]